MIHNQGSFPRELNESIFITLPKVNETIKCEMHRTISLLSHVTRLVLRVVINRIRGRTLDEIAPVQYGFMPDKGTGNAIFVLRRLVERSQSVSTCMKLCVMNCCSMKEKTRLPYILDHVRDNKCDLVTLTWLSPDNAKNASVVQECADYGYTLFHIPRPTRRGGGVGILVKDNISIVRNKIHHLAHNTFEHIKHLITAISLHIRHVVVYRPLNQISTKTLKCKVLMI